MIAELDNLPEISFIDDITLDDIQSQMQLDYEERYETLTGKPCKLRRADPAALLLYACSIQIFQALLYVDRAGKQDLLKYSYGGYMDNLAAIRGITRLEAQPSVTTVRFTLSATMEETKTIPAGTRVTNGEMYFETDEYGEIAVGDTCTDIPCTCQTDGAAGNGIAIGEINILVDSLPYIDTVENLEVTTGGADIEDDEALAERIYIAPSSYSVAGPDDAYEYYTKAFNQSITSVKVLSPAPTEVEIRFLVADGEIPTQTMIDNLKDFLQDENIRPLTDKVNVLAPEQQSFDIELAYYINKSDMAKSESIQNAVETAISEYIQWQTYTIGRDINPSELIKRIIAAGAKRCDVTSPAFTPVAGNTVARMRAKTVTYGGLEDD